MDNLTPQHNDVIFAAAVQKALLDVQVPQCKCGRIFLKNQMSNRLGGDFYYFRALGQEQAIFAIGDVVGHTFSAALLMTFIMGHLQANNPDQRRPSRIMDSVNRELLELGEQVNFPITCSMIYGVVDLPSGILLYVNAGHPHPIIVNRTTGHSVHLPPTTMLLGVQPQEMPESCHQFEPNDRLILFTDGITEMINEKSEYYSEPRLYQFVTAHPHTTPQDLTELIFAELQRFSPGRSADDDQTLIIIDFDNLSSQR